MQIYNSLKLVKILPFSWAYYPDGQSTGFFLSKGYCTGDERNMLFQIVEDGKSKRPSVLLSNVTVEDKVTGGAELSYTSFPELFNKLARLNCPLVTNQINVDAVAGIENFDLSEFSNSSGDKFIRQSDLHKRFRRICKGQGNALSTDQIGDIFGGFTMAEPDGLYLYSEAKLIGTNKENYLHWESYLKHRLTSI